MPLLKPCNYPGCNTLVPHGQKYCEQHKWKEAEQEQTRINYFSGGSKSQFKHLYDTSAWKELSRAQLKGTPFCEKCGSTFNLEVHHVFPHRGDEEMFFNPDNLMTLCHDCHLTETRKEIAERNRERIKDKRTNKLWY